VDAEHRVNRKRDDALADPDCDQPISSRRLLAEEKADIDNRRRRATDDR
jgi:hypothetical protein